MVESAKLACWESTEITWNYEFLLLFGIVRVYVGYLSNDGCEWTLHLNEFSTSLRRLNFNEPAKAGVTTIM